MISESLDLAGLKNGPTKMWMLTDVHMVWRTNVSKKNLQSRRNTVGIKSRDVHWKHGVQLAIWIFSQNVISSNLPSPFLHVNIGSHGFLQVPLLVGQKPGSWLQNQGSLDGFWSQKRVFLWSECIVKLYAVSVIVVKLYHFPFKQNFGLLW